MVEVDREVQTRNLLALAKSPDGFQFTNTFFPYTSGEIGSYYVQSGGILHDGKAYQQACRDIAHLVELTLGSKDRFGDLPDKEIVISGGESRDWMFSGPVAQILGLAYTKIYKDGKLVGANMKGKEVFHVADLNNEGSSPRDLWVPAIKKAGGRVNDIYFFVDRMEDGVEEMKKLGLDSRAVIPLDEYAWDTLQKAGIVTPEVYQALRARMEDKDGWARAMLRTEGGLETLGALLASSKERPKAIKIIDTGYPDMRDELVDRLKSRFGVGVLRYVA